MDLVRRELRRLVIYSSGYMPKRCFATDYDQTQYIRPKCEKRTAYKALFWKKVTYLGAFPVLIIVAVFVFLTASRDTVPERVPFVKYKYMRIRHKRFPWGNGDTSFFHNPEVNALSDGYEDEKKY